jgi:hypothetical protein
MEPMREKKGLKKSLPTIVIAIIERMALIPAFPTAKSNSISLGLSCRIGMIAKSGTTAKSCINSTDKDNLPTWLDCLLLSFRTGKTIALEDIAKAAERSKLMDKGKSKKNLIDKPKTIVVKSSCRLPKPKTCNLILISLSIVNSNPITKRRKTTPNSEMAVTCGLLSR